MNDDTIQNDAYEEDHAVPGANEQQAIDRFVDGAMDEEQQRALLSSLDYRDDGWRRLALAFVEDRAWRHDLGTLVDARDEEPTAEVARRSDGSTQGSRWPGAVALASRPLAIAVAMAASFLIAFSVGMQWRDAQSVAPPERSNNIISHVEQPLHEDADLAEAIALAEAGVGSVVLNETRPLLSRDDASDDAFRGSDSVELPVITVSGGRAAWEKKNTPAFPAYLSEVLQELGYFVELRHSLVPVELPDGRRVMIPMEQIEVQREAEPSFQ